jgi:hypothetical protein
MVLLAILLLSTSISAQTIEAHAVLDAKPVLEPKAQAFIEAAPTKPTVVLVHGAFADASSWNGGFRVEEMISISSKTNSVTSSQPTCLRPTQG